MLLGVNALWDRCQLQLELRLRGHGKDEALQGGIMLVAQKEGDLALTALILRLHTDLKAKDIYC